METTNVIYYESPAFKVKEIMKANNYSLASCTGLATFEDTESFDTNMIGILKNVHGINEGGGIFRRNRNRRPFIGVLWLNNGMRKAKEDSRWVLEIQGRNFISELTDFSKKLNEYFKVDIKLNLICENLEFEHFLEDNF